MPSPGHSTAAPLTAGPPLSSARGAGAAPGRRALDGRHRRGQVGGASRSLDRVGNGGRPGNARTPAAICGVRAGWGGGDGCKSEARPPGRPGPVPAPLGRRPARPAGGGRDRRDFLSGATACDAGRRGRPWIGRPRSRPYGGRPGGLRTGSPPSPPPRSIRPTVRRLPRSPRLSGPGPHSGRSISCPAAADQPAVRHRAPNPCYSAASAVGAVASQISRNSSRRFR